MLDFTTGWFTPTSLFLLLNVVIGTIWLTSFFSTHKKQHHQNHQGQQFYSSPPLAGAPSLIDRVKSINFGHFKYETPHPDASQDHYFPSAEHVYANLSAQPTPPLARAPSLLDRVRSVNLNDFQFSFFRSDFHAQAVPEIPHPTEPVVDATPVQYQEPDQNLRRRPLVRAPSLLDRVKSINFTDLHHFSPFRSETPIPEPEVSHPSDPHHDAVMDQHMKRIKSEPSRGEIPARRGAEKMKKSASEKKRFGKGEGVEEVEKRRPATTRVERTVSINGDVEVDAKADDFINKFKQQLQLQRLDSILQYKDMITRGASK